MLIQQRGSPLNGYSWGKRGRKVSRGRANGRALRGTSEPRKSVTMFMLIPGVVPLFFFFLQGGKLPSRKALRRPHSRKALLSEIRAAPSRSSVSAESQNVFSLKSFLCQLWGPESVPTPENSVSRTSLQIHLTAFTPQTECR